MKEKKLLLRNILSLGIVQVCNMVFPLITLPLIARIIGPDKYGVINYSSAVIGYFTLLINYGFEMTATRTIAQSSKDQQVIDGVFSKVLYTKIFLLLISVAAFLVLLYTLPALQQEKKVAVYSFLICFGWVLTPTFVYQGMQQLDKIALFNLGSKVIFTIVVLLTIHQKADYVLQPLAFSIAQIAVSLYSFFYAFRLYRIRLVPYRWADIVDTLKEGRMIFFSMLANSLYVYTSVLILGMFRGTVEIGYYSAASRVILIAISVIFIPINQAMFPYIGTAFARSREEGLEMIRKTFPLGFALSLGYGVAILLFSPLIVKLLFGPAFYDAIPVLKAMAFVPLVINCGMFLGLQGLINLKMDKEYAQIIFVSGLISIPVNIAFSYYWGEVGTGLCWLLIEVLVAVLFFLKLRKNNVNLISREYFTFRYLTHTSLRIILPKK